MPKPRSPDTDRRSEERKQSEQLYLDSKGKLKIVEIAEQLGLSSSKVRKWKSLDDWDKKLHSEDGNEEKKDKKDKVERSPKQVERSTKEKGSVPPKRGAPKGSKNAKGNKGNPNPNPPPDRTIHGGYSSVYWDTLSDDEKQLIEEMPKDEEMLLIEQIQLFSVRERRIMMAINEYRKSKKSLIVNGALVIESKRKFDNAEEEELYKQIIAEKVNEGKRLPGTEYNTQTQTDNKDNIIMRLESELSNVQAKKTRAIEALTRLHMEKTKLEGDTKGNDAVRLWVEKVKAMRGTDNG